MKKILLIWTFFMSVVSVYSQLNTDRLMLIGQNAFEYSDYVLSIQYFSQIISVKPYLAEPYMFRAMAKIQLGDYEGAVSDASKAIERNPFIAHAYYTRGFANERLGNYADVEKDIEMALEYSPDNQDYIKLRAQSHEKAGNYLLAVEDLKLLQKINRKESGLNYEIGRMYIQAKDTTNAENYFRVITKVNPSSYTGWSALALLKMQQNDKDSALFFYNMAIAKSSTYSGDYINRGIINNEKNNFRQALIDYDNAIKYDNNEYLGYYNRALLRSYLGDNNNAIEDLDKVISIDSTFYEAIWKRATLQSSIGKYRSAVNDYNHILKKYPYFLPAIYGIAEAEDALGNIKNAFRHRQLAQNIEKNKEYYKQKSDKKELSDKNVNKTSLEEKTSTKAKTLASLFSEQAASGDSVSANQNVMHGEIQNQSVEVKAESDFELSYVALIDLLRRTNLFNSSLKEFNDKKIIPSELKISNIKAPHNKEYMQLHMLIMGEVSEKIANDPSNPDYYFCRSIESISSYDFNGAMDDLNKTISLNPNYTLAYFSRAFLSYKMYYNHMFDQDKPMEYIDELTGKKITLKLNATNKINLQSIINDYDRTIVLQPDFTFAYYNKANLLIIQKDYKSAIDLYTKAIEIDPDFAEAYFNRGLTWLFTGDDKKGMEDLSKAGELGIYQAYNLIKRFVKQ